MNGTDSRWRWDARRAAACSDLLQLADRPLVLHVARIERGGGLEEEDLHFLFRYGAVLDAAGHDQEFPFLQPDVAVPELHAETALHDHEELVLMLVVMPDEFALELRELHMLAVELADDLGAPVIGEGV